MNNLNVIKAVAVVAISLLATSCRESAAPKAEKVYKTLTIAKSDTEVSTRYTASIRGEQFVDIRPQVSGVITKIAIEEGAAVKKGETLFVIDQVPYEAALSVAQANVASAESAVAIAQMNADSGVELYEQDVISKIELQTLQNTLLSAKATLAQAEAEVTIARNNLSYTVVKSPVDGVASMINYRIGALVSSSITDPLVSVANNDKMYAYFSISESALLTLIEQSGSSDELLHNMSAVTLTLNNGSTYAHQGRVDAISGVIDSSTGSVGMRAVFDNPEQMLRDGGNGSLSIANSYEDVIVIPKVATYEIQDKTFVFKVIDGKASSSQVTILKSDNGRDYIVTSGVEVGDVIVAEGAGLLREGTIINAK